jgi:hypothetical protein
MGVISGAVLSTEAVWSSASPWVVCDDRILTRVLGMSSFGLPGIEKACRCVLVPR